MFSLQSHAGHALVTVSIKPFFVVCMRAFLLHTKVVAISCKTCSGDGLYNPNAAKSNTSLDHCCCVDRFSIS